MSSVGSAALWAIAAIAITGILARPRRTPEWLWAVGAAVVLVTFGLLPLRAALGAIARGADVYAFLIGIITLAEIARYERVFDWIAGALLRAGNGSPARLLGLVYVTGTVATVFLSNDTTAVVLTPAVYAALARTELDPMPYLYACAFVANAASFVLPISNPANLVVFGHTLPALLPWVHTYGLPALAAIGLTYATLRLATGASLRGTYRVAGTLPELDSRGRIAATVVGLATLALVVAAFRGWNVGVTALAGAAAALALSTLRDRSAPSEVLRHVSWGVIPLVAGLFVVVQALDRSGAIDAVRHLLAVGGNLDAARGNLLVAAVFTVADNVFNNLPVALAGGYALQSMHAASHIAGATLIAVDLGPNLSVTGSLATLLWLVALRRDRIEVTAWQFLRLGVVVVVPALATAVLLVR